MHTKPGIYQIINLQNGKCYIGSSKNLSLRCRQHKTALSNNRHYNRHLQSAWNQYGSIVFEFRPILYCNREDLAKAEQYWIDFLKPEYNVVIYVGSPNKGIPCSPERKAKLSAHFKDKPLSKEHSEKISKAKLGKPLSNEHRTKTLDKYRIPKKPVERIHSFTGEVREYESVRAASLDGFNKAHITTCLKSGKTHKNFYWNLLPPPESS